jgi:hypothetical protein
MAFGRETNAGNVKPLQGSVISRFIAGATIEAGEIVAIMADGFVDPANTAAFTGAIIVGIALEGVTVGRQVDVVTHGRVKCLIDATPAAIIYASDTAGEPSATAGTKSAIVGKAIAADVLFVNVQQVALS